VQSFVPRITMPDLSSPRAFAGSAVQGRALTKIKLLWRPAFPNRVSLLLVFMLAATAGAQQQTTSLEMSSNTLPDAPLPQVSAGEGGRQSTNTEVSATVFGVVLDTSGAAIPGAQVSLTHTDGSQVRAMVSGASGEFSFTKLPVGSFLIVINANGFATFTSGAFDLAVHQAYEVSNISLSVAAMDMEVTVRPTEVIAAEQIRAEEKQRLLGVMPNFYVSYVKDAAPLTSKQKFSLATHDTFDWASWVGISMTAGIEQANNTFAGYGQGAAGYGKRWAAQFGDGRTSDYLSHAVFASLFHQDPRYFYQGTGTTKSRLYLAVSNAWIARSDSGKNMPNYSYLLGAMCSGALSNLYYPHADRGLNLVFTNALIGVAGRAGGTVLQEFLGKRLTKHSTASANATP
jgi:Carboxypeptidase regulatory-like domain